MARLAHALLLIAACGVDNRPKTIQYVTEAILAPSCGQAECHSTFSPAYTDIFDTVVGARSTIVRNNLVVFDSAHYDPEDPANAHLIVTLTSPSGSVAAIGRMPWDAPIADEDIDLLEAWIAAKAPGAQCDPDKEFACDDALLVKCNSDWSFGDVVASCANGCALDTVTRVGACQ